MDPSTSRFEESAHQHQTVQRAVEHKIHRLQLLRLGQAASISDGEERS
jgi:hypothetical protein